MRRTIMLATLLLMIPLASALGVSPAGKLVEYEPGEELILEFFVLNNENKDMEILLDARGEFEDSIEVLTPRLFFTSEEEAKPASVRLTIPRDMGPGDWHSYIYMTEMQMQGDGNVVARQSVGYMIRMTVPHEGKFLDTAFMLRQPDHEKGGTFTISYYNKGSETIEEAYSEIEYGVQGEVFSYSSLPVTLLPGQIVQSEVILHSSPRPGRYEFSINTYYDGEVKEEKQAFSIGTRKLFVERLEVPGFRIAEPNRLIIDAWTQWNIPFAAQAVFQILDGEVILVESTSTSVQVDGEATFELFFDADISEGLYEAQVIFIHGDLRDEHKYEAYISMNRILFEQEPEKQSNLIPWIVTFLVLLTLSAAIIIRFITKK